MKILSVLLAVVFGFVLVPAVAQDVVVVELFTSEGCSSCPPADALLVQLSQMKGPNGSDIIVLGEHVDYWNYIGWTDRFSSPQFSNRQQRYADRFGLNSPYTPQAVVDGTVQFVGNDKAKLAETVSQRSKTPKAAVVSLELDNHQLLHIAVRTTLPSKDRVFLAVTEDGLTTEVARGENSGRTLHHAGVVRSLRDLGKMSGSEFEKTIPLAIEPGWNPSKLKVVVWVQGTDLGPITGAASLPLAEGGGIRPAATACLPSSSSEY
jgi:hypothetical protein